MSYDVSFKVKLEGIDQYIEVGDCDANITWNVRKIIELSTGLPWLNMANNGLCSKVMPNIIKGFSELEKYPEKYKEYEDENGWGTVEGTKYFFNTIIHKWENLQKYSPELAEVVTFWVE